MPAVIRPITKPGRTSSSRTPLPCSESASPRANASRPGLGRAVHEVGLARADRRDRGQHHDRARAPCVPQPRRAPSSVVTWPVKLVSTSSPGPERVAVQHLPGRISTPAAEMTRSTGPSAKTSSTNGLVGGQRGGVVVQRPHPERQAAAGQRHPLLVAPGQQHLGVGRQLAARPGSRGRSRWPRRAAARGRAARGRSGSVRSSAQSQSPYPGRIARYLRRGRAAARVGAPLAPAGRTSRRRRRG